MDFTRTVAIFTTAVAVVSTSIALGAVKRCLDLERERDRIAAEASESINKSEKTIKKIEDLRSFSAAETRKADDEITTIRTDSDRLLNEASIPDAPLLDERLRGIAEKAYKSAVIDDSPDGSSMPTAD